MIIIKTILYGLILIISILIGILIAKKYTNRVKNLREIKNALNNFKTKIKFTYEPIPEIFEEIAASIEGETKEIFKNTCRNMETKNASDAWNEAIEKSQITIQQEDKEVLKNLSKLLGKTDVEGQLSEIELTTSFLDTQIKKAEQERDKNEKLYKSLGVITGIGLIIILI